MSIPERLAAEMERHAAAVREILKAAAKLPTPAPEDDFARVIAACEDAFGVQRGRVFSRTREMDVVDARHCAIWIATTVLEMRALQVARRLKVSGDAVRYGLRRAEAMSAADLKFRLRKEAALLAFKVVGRPA